MWSEKCSLLISTQLVVSLAVQTQTSRKWRFGLLKNTKRLDITAKKEQLWPNLSFYSVCTASWLNHYSGPISPPIPRTSYLIFLRRNLSSYGTVLNCTPFHSQSFWRFIQVLETSFSWHTSLLQPARKVQLDLPSEHFQVVVWTMRILGSIDWVAQTWDCWHP